MAAILRAADAARVILIGGQAVGFWSERYLERCPELQAEAPFSSRDVDFQGDRAGVAVLAASLGARAYFPRSMEDVTNTGYLEVRLGDVEVGVNVLVSPYGVPREVVEASAVRTRLGDFELRVMHPVLCMESRLANVAGLGREGPRSLAQARASIVCAREFIRELVDLGEVRSALRLCERVYAHARSNSHARAAFAKHGLDAFAAVTPWPGLPARFLATRLPQMQRLLAARRRRT